MTPFDQNIDTDAGHTIDPSIDQDDLIAFHLRELPRQQKLAVLRALQNNPNLRAESMAIASTLRAFPKHEAPLPLNTAALDRHWLTLRRSLPIHVPPAIAPRSLFSRWAIPTLAASALAATALILSLHHNPHTNPSTLATSKSPSFAITTPQLTKSAVPSDSTVHPYTAVPSNVAVSTNGAITRRSSPTANLSHSPFNDHLIPQPPTTSLQTQTSNNQPIPQPIITPPLTASSPASTTQQPSSLSSTTPTPSTALSNLPPSRPHHDHTTDLTLSALGNLTPDRSFTSTAGAGVSAVTASYTQSTTPSFGALASFHQQLRPWLGYRLTGSYSHPTFEYTYSTTLGGSGNIVKERIYELSATYVVQGPHRHRITTSAEAGAALLAFHPTNPNQSISPPHATNLPAGVFGVSAELALTRHLALHAGYRALLYDIPANYPTYGATVPSAPGNLTLTSEPVAGITYRFHPTSE
jgi:hypothetical protein